MRPQLPEGRKPQDPTELVPASGPGEGAEGLWQLLGLLSQGEQGLKLGDCGVLSSDRASGTPTWKLWLTPSSKEWEHMAKLP